MMINEIFSLRIYSVKLLLRANFVCEKIISLHYNIALPFSVGFVYGKHVLIAGQNYA